MCLVQPDYPNLQIFPPENRIFPWLQLYSRAQPEAPGIVLRQEMGKNRHGFFRFSNFRYFGLNYENY
jgi:hypothetical protein